MPPAPGRMARRVSGRATREEVVKRRREVVRASSRPPPRAREERAERVGMGRVVIWVKVARRVWRKWAVLFRGGRVRLDWGTCCAGWEIYSSCVIFSRSLRSAPAQKAVSISLAMIKARVGPASPSAWRDFIWWDSSVRSWTEMALRAEGRLRERMRMLPECGAGIVRMLMVGAGEDEVIRVRWCGWEVERRPGEEKDRRRRTGQCRMGAGGRRITGRT